MILLTHPAQIYQADSKNKDLGKSYMIQDKAIKILQLTVGVAKYCVCVCVTRVSMRCPKFRFPIGVIVFDELELISFVSQGLTLSTASLVKYENHDLAITRSSSSLSDPGLREAFKCLIQCHCPGWRHLKV